jgi:hypothetical protein
MTLRSNVAPDTLGVSLTETGVEVEYLDGRTVFYRGVPEKVDDSFRSAPGKDVHVLVTDETEQQGVLVYVNDLKTQEDILQATGVGRVVLEDGGIESLFPGVTARVVGHRVEVEVDFETTDGRVFVFEEDEMGEQSYEIVADS